MRSKFQKCVINIFDASRVKISKFKILSISKDEEKGYGSWIPNVLDRMKDIIDGFKEENEIAQDRSK